MQLWWCVEVGRADGLLRLPDQFPPGTAAIASRRLRFMILEFQFPLGFSGEIKICWKR